MTIVPTGGSIAAAALVVSAACTACGGASVELKSRVDAESQPIAIDVILDQGNHAVATRVMSAASGAFATLAPILGPLPDSSITILDRAAAARRASASAIVLDAIPVWTTPQGMAVELDTARAVVRRYWTTAADLRALPDWFVDGLVEYWARRCVTPIFRRVNLGTGYAMLEMRFFGRLVPEVVRIRLEPDQDGEPIDSFRRRPHVDVVSQMPDERRALAGKALLTIATLERWLGPPAFDGVLAELARASRRRQVTLDDVFVVISGASGEDVSWLRDQALRSTATFDYAVRSLDSQPLASGYRTTVIVERRGEAMFAGTNAPQVGPFESGVGLALRVAFADGERIDDRWDGRDLRRTFVYDAPAPAVAAEIDPDAVLALDLNRTNNGATTRPRSVTAATRWSALWAQWLEHLLLTWSFVA